VVMSPSSLRSDADDPVASSSKNKKGKRCRRRRSKARKSKRKTRTAQMLDANSFFGGMVKVLKGDDVEALVARSLALSDSELLAYRLQIWDVCERCARCFSLQYVNAGMS
jgi:hypothetical protein